MPALVTPGRPGRRVIVRQRSVEAPPFTNCRLMVGVQGLVFGGVAVPDKERLVRVLRRATGVPEIGPSGAQGTTAADWLRALSIELPWVQVTAGLETDDVILGGLARGEHHVGVAVPRYNGLPGNLSRWSPGFDGGHMIGLLDARGVAGDDPDVLWSDPLAMAPARAEWVRWKRVRPHLSQAGGRVFATLTARGAAMSTSIVLQRVLPAGSSARIPKGTKLWTVDDDAIALLEAKPAGMAARPLVDLVVRVDQAPKGPGRPTGRFVHVVDGPLAGRYVRLADVSLVEADPGDPVDVEAIRAIAFAAGQEAGEAEALERYQLVDEPLYRRAVPA
jgi:hypothetical protein